MTQLRQIDEGLAKLDEDSYRLSWSDNPSDRDRYLDFSRSQAWGFLAQAYAHSDSLQKAKEYLALFDNSGYGKTFMGRRMIAPTQVALGMYDEALRTYDEIERRMAGDTLNKDYATILRSRAIAARTKGHIAEALECGFRSYSTFAAAFKLFNGQTVTSWIRCQAPDSQPKRPGAIMPSASF